MGFKLADTQPDGLNGGAARDQRIISLIRRLPEAEPPKDFSWQVMSRLADPTPPLRVRCKQALMRFFSGKSIPGAAPRRWGLAAVLVATCVVLFRLAGGPGAPHDPERFPDLAEGVRLLEAERFAEARRWFEGQLPQKAEEPALNYYLGRTYLALDQPREALDHLQHAAQAETGRPEYHFWLGLCHYALSSPRREMAAYQQALNLDPDFLPAHVYAGHHYMDRRQWAQALGHYQRVLAAVPEHAEALFNSAVALHHLGRKAQENENWRSYLALYSGTPQALQAVGALNANGDFAFRVHRIAGRTMVLPGLRFGDDPCQPVLEDLAALRPLGAQAATGPATQTLLIVGYADGDAALARCRVQRVKAYLLSNFPELKADQIRLGWLGVPEKIRQGDTTRFVLDGSIRFFTLPTNSNAV